MLGLEGGVVMGKSKSRVVFFETDDHKAGITSAMRALDTNPVKNKNVLIKPNFNTADRYPGSTHNDTLVGLVEEVWGLGAKSVAVGDRSYPPT